MRLILAAATAFALAGHALAAQPVVLRPALADEDGRITLGELFDGAGRAASIVVATVKPGASAVLEASEVQRVALANGLSWSNAAGLRRVVVRPAGEIAAAAPRGGVEALTYTHSLATGDIVGPGDLAWTRVAAAPADAPRDAEALIGMAAKRPLRAGSAAAQRDVASPLLVKKDDIVTVSYDAGGVSLSLQAKALDSASAGDTFNALNPASKKIIQAVAVGPSRGVVGPASAQYRGPAGRTSVASIR